MKFLKNAHKRINYDVVRFAFTSDGLTPGIFTYRGNVFFPVWINGNIIDSTVLEGSFRIPSNFVPSHVSGLYFSPPITIEDKQYFLVEIEDNGTAHMVDMLDVRKLHANMLCSYRDNKLSVNIIDLPASTKARFIIGKGRPLYARNTYFMNDVLIKIEDQLIHGEGKYIFEADPIPEGYTAYLLLYDSIKGKYYITNTYRFGVLKDSISPVLVNIYQIDNGIALNFNSFIYPLYIFRRTNVGSYETVGVAYDSHIYIDIPYTSDHFIYKVGYILNNEMVYSNELGINFVLCESLKSPNVNVISLSEGDFYMDITRILEPVVMRYGITRTATQVFYDDGEHEIRAAESILANRLGAYIINRTSGNVYIYADNSVENPETHGIILEPGKDIFLQIEESRWYFKAESGGEGGVTIIEVG